MDRDYKTPFLNATKVYRPEPLVKILDVEETVVVKASSRMSEAMAKFGAGAAELDAAMRLVVQAMSRRIDGEMLSAILGTKPDPEPIDYRQQSQMEGSPVWGMF